MCVCVCVCVCVCFQFVAFVREHMWHKAFLMGYSMRLELNPLREPSYFKIYPYSFFGPTITIFIYIYMYIYRERHISI